MFLRRNLFRLCTLGIHEIAQRRIAMLKEVMKLKLRSLNRRFCLYRGEERKIRVIDNYKDSGVNAAFSSSSYLALQDTDFIVGFLRFVMVMLSGRDLVIVPLSDGQVLVGAWHPTTSAGPSWVGRCIDLSKAYKQVAIPKQ